MSALPVDVCSAAESRALFAVSGPLDCDCHEAYHEMGVHAPDYLALPELTAPQPRRRLGF